MVKIDIDKEGLETGMEGGAGTICVERVRDKDRCELRGQSSYLSRNRNGKERFSVVTRTLAMLPSL